MINNITELLALASANGVEGVVQTGPNSYTVDGTPVHVDTNATLDTLLKSSRVDITALRAAIASGRVNIVNVITTDHTTFPSPPTTTTTPPPRFEDEHQLLSATPPILPPPPGLQQPNHPLYPSWGDADRGAVPPPPFPSLQTPFSGMYPTPDDLQQQQQQQQQHPFRRTGPFNPRFDPPGPPFF